MKCSVEPRLEPCQNSGDKIFTERCSVKIIDDDVFPSNQFAELARKGRASVESSALAFSAKFEL